MDKDEYHRDHEVRHPDAGPGFALMLILGIAVCMPMVVGAWAVVWGAGL
jgi:hypothetical protein